MCAYGSASTATNGTFLLFVHVWNVHKYVLRTRLRYVRTAIPAVDIAVEAGDRVVECTIDTMVLEYVL
jgi:hypothetical protein